MEMVGKVGATAIGIILFVLIYMVGVPQLISAQNDWLVLLGITIIVVSGLSALAFAFTMIKKGFTQDKKEDLNGK